MPELVRGEAGGNSISPSLSAWYHWQPHFKIITAYVVESCYPGDSATADQTQHAMHICKEGRQPVRMQLKLIDAENGTAPNG